MLWIHHISSDLDLSKVYIYIYTHLNTHPWGTRLPYTVKLIKHAQLCYVAAVIVSVFNGSGKLSIQYIRLASMGLLPDTQNRGLRMRRGCRERFPRHLLQRKPLVSDPGKHHGTCVTHVPWCMSGSLNRGSEKKFPAFPAHAQPAILRIWQEAHGTKAIVLLSFCSWGNPQGYGPNSLYKTPNVARHDKKLCAQYLHII